MVVFTQVIEQVLVDGGLRYHEGVHSHEVGSVKCLSSRSSASKERLGKSFGCQLSAVSALVIWNGQSLVHW